MRDRFPTAAAPPTATDPLYAIDVALFTPVGRQLAVLVTRVRRRAAERIELPWGAPRGRETWEGAARRIARTAATNDPSWLEQLGAFGDGDEHPAGVELSVAFLAVLPLGSQEQCADNAAWVPMQQAQALPKRHLRIAEQALHDIRRRMDHAPIAFHLLPALFTLSEVQLVYEILLERRLHKASFRRALHTARLVEPSDEWRSEGRGRPAQLFRYVAPKPTNRRRSVRFDAIR